MRDPPSCQNWQRRNHVSHRQRKRAQVPRKRPHPSSRVQRAIRSRARRRVGVQGRRAASRPVVRRRIENLKREFVRRLTRESPKRAASGTSLDRGLAQGRVVILTTDADLTAGTRVRWSAPQDYDAHDVMEFGHHRRLAGSFPTGAMLTTSFNTVPHFPQAGVSSPCGFRSFTTTQAPSSQGSSKIRHTHCRVNCLTISSLAEIRDVEGPASTRMLGGRSFFIGQQPGPTLSAQSDSRQCRRSPRSLGWSRRSGAE
jgi:hypothetical protein